MKKIAVIDHSHHRKTKSNAFFLDMLKTVGAVDMFWCDSWKTGRFLDLEALDLSVYDALVFWQVMYPLHAITPYRDKCTLIPMYDGAWRDSDLFWLKYRGFRFVNFSRILHVRMKRLGMNSLYAQYFPMVHSAENQPADSATKPMSAFFWQRSTDVSWNTIKRLITYCNIEKIHYHMPDNNQSVSNGPDPDDIRQYGISFSRWFPARRSYWSLIDSVDIYFAPRVREGIGLSFLEAMAMGKCVVAPDFPTMNEYIINGVNGILYNPRSVSYTHLRAHET